SYVKFKWLKVEKGNPSIMFRDILPVCPTCLLWQCICLQFKFSVL
uniref:Uncharacterized protein n=1 Tax=Amphimedon queenslandica TaxID=400682 RepID=A0A1X7UFN8_AMPQE